jgi:hypothetical protein
MRVRQIVCIKATILNVATLKLSDIRNVLQLTRRTKRWRRLIGEHSHDKLSRLESINHACYQIAVAGRSDVALEANVRIVRLGCYVNCHVATLKRDKEN